MNRYFITFQYFSIILFLFVGCKTINPENIQDIDRIPKIDPDYTEVTIPPNIAPLNFAIKEGGLFFWVKIFSDSHESILTLRSAGGIIQIPERYWKELLVSSRGDKIQIQTFIESPDKKSIKRYKPFFIYIAEEKIDPYLVYRLIHPGYHSWSDIKIVQRSLESFREESLIENQLIEKNCVNCHSFNDYNPNRFLVHIRGSKGGTYFIEDDQISRVNLKNESMPAGATYPAWHPGGRFVAFSSNEVRQNFYAHPKKSIEVYDLYSSLILYDRNTNEIVNITEQDSVVPLQTFPSWSPDGAYIYYCSADFNKAYTNLDFNDIKNIRYNLEKRSFDPISGSFGKAELVFNASERNKSVSFPRISPNGKYMVLTIADYGTFPIWHQEADLYLLDLQNGACRRMSLNSEMTESYHTWSSNGKWLVFSSKRLDGRSATPFFAYIDSWDHIGKPFVLPQADPAFYHKLLKSFNIPELIKGKITTTPRDFVSAARTESVQARAGNPSEVLPKWFYKKNEERSEIEKGIHE